MQPTSVLATVTGRDRTGVTAAFFAALAAHDVDIRDVEQVVIRDRLVLTVLCDLRGDPGALRASAMTTAHALGMECEVTVADDAVAAAGPRADSAAHVMVLGRPLRPGAVSHVAQRVAALGANIESITQVSAEPVASLEMVVRTREPGRLRNALVHAAEDTGVDIAVEPAELQRRPKRLVVLDADSVLGGGVEGGARPLSDTRRYVRTLQRLGYRVGAVGTSEHLSAELGLDFVANGSDRAAALARFAGEYGIPLSQTVAAGDCARNLGLLAAAGLGIAVHPNSPSALDTVLFVLGISPEDVAVEG